ncbi:MAG: CoA ester lyase [Desulfobacterales bacterium]|nr:CoA ester lyase [Desulfobacterales bacterium]
MKPRRSILSVPGHVEKMHRKAAGCAADVVMLDLEDSVPVDAKEDARRQVIRSALKIDWGEKTLTFRSNALDTPFGYRDLLEVLEAAGDRLDAVVIPKIDHPGDIHFVHRLMAGIEMRLGGRRPVGIEASVESAEGLSRVREIAAASDRLISLIFGIVDFQVSIGARLVSISGHGEAEESVYPGHRWNFAMSRMVMAAKAAGLAAIDAPYGHFRDQEALRRWAAVAAALGFDGKWAIHPDQIDAINEIFSPSAEEIERARKVLDAFEAAAAHRRGAVSVDGRMVDEATIRLARRTWELALRLGLAEEKQGR